MKTRTPLMNLHSFAPVLFLLLVLSILLRPVPADASVNRITDQAGLLAAGAVSSLEDTILALESEYSVSIRILTEHDLSGKSTTRFLEDYFDSEYAAGRLAADAVLLLVSMEPGNRTVEIQGYGICEDLISYNRIDNILDKITPMLSRGDYRTAFETFLERTGYYLGHEEVPFYFTTLFQVIAALAIGAITVAVLLPRDSGRITTNSRTYLNQEHSGVTASRDIYLRTLVTRTRRPDSNSGGGSRNTGGRSSGGASHSGGSRGF